MPGSLRYVDPNRRRGRLYRALANLIGTRSTATWLSRNIGWKLDPVLLRVSKGRVRATMVVPSAVLETRGARTGARRRNAVIYFHDGDRVTVVPSNLGGPKHPGWFHNAVANPDVMLNGEPYRARVVDDPGERARLWALADKVFPPYAVYRERAAAVGREIPLLQLEPAAR
jgi:deazaflavin-dependent oxidoreductase (nitroreductase family)